jgi:two-component sensor histidine kinase
MPKISTVGSGPYAGWPSPLADAERLDRALDAGGAGAWEWHVEDGAIHINQKLASLLGLRPHAPVLPESRFFALVHPDDLALLRVALGEATAGGHGFAHEFRICREDTREARWLWSQSRVCEPMAPGETLMLTGLVFDVTERRFAQETRELLNRELSHRLKNLLSIVGSLVVMTGEQRPEAREFVTLFQARLNNLAAAHDLLVQSEWQPVALAKLVEKALTPLGVLDRISLTTNDLVIGSYDAQTLVLVVHELATNAIKYGALSNGSGTVGLSFQMVQPTGADAATLLIAWQETGGPEVAPPTTKGFGVDLLERLGRRQEPDQTVLDWRKEGLCCHISLRINPRRAPG